MVSHPLGAVPPATVPGVVLVVAPTVKASGNPLLDTTVSARVSGAAPPLKIGDRIQHIRSALHQQGGNRRLHFQVHREGYVRGAGPTGEHNGSRVQTGVETGPPTRNREGDVLSDWLLAVPAKGDTRSHGTLGAAILNAGVPELLTKWMQPRK